MPVAVPRSPVKKAVCIGVEYVELAKLNPDWNLTGTYADTLKLTKLLEKIYGYRPEDIKLLTDAKPGAVLPTRANIIAAMKDLVKDAVAGDHLLFHYSGHGSQTRAPADHINETDGFDEIIWPCDIQGKPDNMDADDHPDVSNFIVDDEIHDILVEGLPTGVHLTIILDSCNSGTGADLPNYCGASAVSSPTEGQTPFSLTAAAVSTFSKPPPPVIATPTSAPTVAEPPAKTLPTSATLAAVPTTSPLLAPPKLSLTLASPTMATVRAAPRARGLAAMPHNVLGVMDNQKSVSILSLPTSARVIDPEKLPYVTSWSACLDNQVTLEDNTGGIFIQAFTEVLGTHPHVTNAQLLSQLTQWIAKNVHSDIYETTKPQLGSVRDIASIRDSVFEI